MHFQMNTNYTTIKTFCGYNGLYYNQKRCFFHKEKRTRDNKTTPDEHTVTTVSVQTDILSFTNTAVKGFYSFISAFFSGDWKRDRNLTFNTFYILR